MPLMQSPGSSRVSSMVRILWLSGNSKSSALSRELFPAPRAPHIRTVARLLTMNESIPATRGLTVPFAISRDRVHGRTACLRIAIAFPRGLRGYPTTVALASNPRMSVSSTGLERQKRRPLSRLRMFRRLDTSLSSAIRFVEHLMWELRPLMPFTVTWIRFSEHGASTYTSSMCLSESRTSNIPAPTEWRYAMAHTSLMTASASPSPIAPEMSSHLSVSTDRVIPMTVSRSRLPPSSR